MSVTFDEVSQRIKAHLDERDWGNNPPRGLAISIVLEAAELLEHYQWTDESVGSRDDVAEEVADIFIYCFQLALMYDIDIPKVIEQKLKKAAQKYPAEHFKGKTEEEIHKQWIADKLNHKKAGL